MAASPGETRKVHILVANADGIDSEGLHVLARCLPRHGQVVALAPDEECSGAGATISRCKSSPSPGC